MRAATLFTTAFLALAGSAHSRAQDFPFPDLNALGEDLASKIAPKMIAKVPATGRLRVAAFAFGDRDGKVSARMGISPQLLQTALIDALAPKLALGAPGKFKVLTDVGLRATFDTLALAPDGINSKDLDTARKVLAKANIQVGIVGSFDIDDTTPLSGAGAVEAVKVTMTAIYASDQDTCDSRIFPWDIIQYGGVGSGDPAVTPSGRFGVRIFYKPDDTVADSAPGAWEEIPLQISKDPKSDSFNVYFLVLDPKKHKGKRYKVVLKNAGTPPLFKKLRPEASPPPGERDRMIAAALLVDGVNSLPQRPGMGPVVVHPQLAKKWLLTGPGRRLVRDPAGTSNLGGFGKRLENGRLETVEGNGGSVVEVEGFLQDSKVLCPFTFSEADASIPETLGLTNDVGMIVVAFYAEVLFREPMGLPLSTATIVVKDVYTSGFDTKVLLHNSPVECFRIVYRYKGDSRIPGELSLSK